MVLIDHSQAVQTTRQTTTSSTNVDIPSVSIADTFFNTGEKYLILASAQLDTISVGDESGITTLHGSTEFDGADQFIEHAPGINPKKNDYFYWTVWTAVASEGIKMQFRQAGAGTTGVDQVVLTAISLNDLTENTDWHFDENLTNTTLNTGFSTTNNASVIFTPASAGDDWLVLSRGRVTPVNDDADNQLESRFTRSGEASFNTSVISQQRETTNEFFVQSNMHVFNLGVVSNTFTQESRIVGENASDRRTDSAIFAINLAKFKVSSSSATTTGAVNLTTTNFAEEVETVSITPISTVDVFTLGYFVLDNGVVSGGEARIQVDNIDSPATQTSDAYQRNDGWSGQDQHDFFHQTIINLDNTAHTVDMDASSTLTGPDVLNSSLVAFTLEIVTPNTETFTIDAFIQALGDNGNCGAKTQTQSGTATISATSTSTDVTIPEAVVLADSFLVFQFNIDAVDPANVLVRGQMTSTTNIHFERTGTVAQVNITWYVVEFPERVSAQRGNVTMTALTTNQTITSVDTTESFDFASWENGGVEWGDNDAVRHQITSATNLEFLVDTLPVGFEPIIDWEVIEYTGARVIRGTTTFASGTSSEDITIASVDLSRSIVQLSNNIDAFTGTPAIHGLTGELTTSTNLHIQRDATGAVMEIAWIVIEFPNHVRVQSGVESLGTSQTVANVAINQVSLKNTAVFLSHDRKGGRTNDVIDDNPHTIWYTAELTTATNLQLTRGASDTSTGDVSWFVVQFGPEQRACALVDAILTPIKPFTVDAIIFIAQIDKDFTINAFLQTTFDETFTVDAFVQATFTQDFTVDAIVQATQTETFTIDAFIQQQNNDETFTVDAILKATFTETFLVDAFIQALNQEKTFLVDGFIEAENQKMFLVDGLAQATQTETFDIDARLIVRNTETFDVDAKVIVRKTTTFDVDGLIQRQNIDETFTIDAFVQATQTKDFTIDGLPQATQTKTFTIDAFVQATQTETFTVDAFLQATFDEDFLIDAFLQATQTETFTVDSITVGTKFPFTVDGFPQATFTETFLVDAFVQQLNINKDFTVDAVTVEQNTESFIVDGLLLEQDKTTTFTLDSLLQGQNQKLFIVDGTLAGEADEDFIVDGLLEVVNTETFDIDAILLQTNTETFTVDSILVVRNDETFDINGLLQDTFDEDFTIDSILFQINSETFLIDAQLVTANTEIFDVDTLLKATQTKDFTVDSRLLEVNTKDFTVDAVLAVRKNFQVDAVLVRQVTTDVDAILKDTNDKDFLVDSILKQGNQEFFLIDALLVVVNTETFTVDAQLAERKTKDYTVDALLKELAIDKTFSVDAGLAEGKTTTFTVDSILIATPTETFTVDSMLRLRQTKTFLVDTFLQGLEQTEVFEVDSILKGFDIDKTFIVDGNVQLIATTEVFTVDAQLAKLALQKNFIVDTFIQQLSNTETFTVDAIIVNVIPATIDKVFTIDGVLKAFNQTETFIIRAIVFKVPSKIIDVDSMLQATLTETVDVDALLVNVKTETFDVDAVLITIAVIDEEFLVDAFVKSLDNNFNFLVDGNTELVSGVTATVDALLRGTLDQLATVDAILSPLTAVNDKTFTVDAIISGFVALETFDVNALLKVLDQEKTFLVDTFSQGVNTKDFLVDSILAGEGQKPFLVDAQLLKEQTESFTITADIRNVKTTTFSVDAVIFKSGDVLCSAFSTTLAEDWSVASSDPVNLQGWILINSASPITVLFNTPSFPNVLRMQCMGSPQNHFATKLFTRIISNDRDFIWQFKHNHIDGCTKFQTRMSTNLQEDAVLNKVPNQTTIRYRSFNGNFGEDVFLQIFDKNGVLKVTSSMIDLFNDTVVFPSIERVAGIVTLNVYTDEARTTHIAGSPVSVDTNSFEMNSLNAIYFGNIGTSGGGRQAREEFDDILVIGDLCPRIKIDAFLQALDQEKDFTIDAKLSTPVKFTVDAFLDGGSIDVTFFVDAILEAISGERTFTINALLVRDADFTADGLIKAIGDIRCQPSFLEKIFFDDLTDISNWSTEINNTTVDGWATQEIFIDGETVLSDGIVRATMKPGGFSGGDTPVFKTKYRRKLIASEGGIGIVVDGAKVRLEFEYTHIVGSDGTPIGLNKTGAHPENDPNTSSFHIFAGGAGSGTIALVLDSGLTSVSTGTIQVGTGIKRFVVAESIGNTVTLNVYSDPEHTTHVTGSPVFVDSSTVDKNDLNFTWLFVGANSKLLAPTNPNTTVEMDEIHIYASPCPIVKVDAFLVEFFGVNFTIGARLVRQIKVNIDAVLRGRNDFTVDALLVREVKFDVDARLAGVETEDFFINVLLKSLDSEKGFLINAILIRGALFTVSAIFSTEPSDPNFSLTHMQSIIHMFSGIVDKLFQIDATLSGRLEFTVDAKLVTPLTITVDAVLSTEPQPLFFSLTHFQDIVPLLLIDESVTTDVNALLKSLDQEETFLVDARLVLNPDEDFFIDSILIQNTKTVVQFVDSLLKALDQEEQTFIDSIVVSRNVEEPLVNAILQKFNVEEDFTINVLLKDLDKLEQVLFDALLSSPVQITTFVDAILKLNGEDGFCNFQPDVITIGTGLEQFVGPVQPEHESDVDLLIGQEFTLNNQQVKRARILLRSTGGITVPSVIQGKIWRNVVKGNVAGEVVEVSSINTIDANVSSGDLPAGVWTEVVFDFGGVLSPFLTGDFLIGIQHTVGSGVDEPAGVGVAQPVISGGNVILGEALFRREDNSVFFGTPDTWKVLISDSIDMVIDLEIVNGDDIILGKGNQCPRVDSIIVNRFTEDSLVNAILVNRKTVTFTINAVLKATNSEDTLIDAVLSPLKGFTIDSQLIVVTISNDETFFVDARLERPNQLKPFLLDSILTTGFQEPFIVDGFFKKQDKISPTFVDSLLKALDQEETFTINAVLLLTTQPEIFVDGLLKLFNVEETFTITGALAVTQPPVTFEIDAQLNDEKERFRVDAFVVQRNDETFIIGARLTDAIEKEYFVNSIIKAFNTDEDFFVDTILTIGFQEPFLIDSHLRVSNSTTTFVNAVLSKDGLISEFTVNSVLVRVGSFTVDGFKKALGDGILGNGNNGSTNSFAVNPFISQLTGTVISGVPVGTNLCGQRLRLPTSPVRVTSFAFKLHRDGLSGSPVGSMVGKIYRNSVAGNPILPADLLDTSDNTVLISTLGTDPSGTNIFFNFSTVEITPDDNIFIGIQLTGTNEEVFFGTETTGTVIAGGDFNTSSGANWGADQGIDTALQIFIDDEPRQRGSALVSAILGVRSQTFLVDGNVKAGNVDKEFFVDGKIVFPKSVEFTIGAILIGSVDVTIGAFVGEIQETVLDVESVVVTNNSDIGVESTIGVGGT